MLTLPNKTDANAVVHWPVQAAASCAAWLHEWLR